MANYHDARTVEEKIAHLREWGCGGCRMAADDWENDRGELLAEIGQARRSANGWKDEKLAADREIDRLQAAIIEVERILIRGEAEAGSTHWDGCESQHPACAALAVIAGLVR